MTNKEIGYRIKSTRESLGLTKKDLAARIKVADSTIKRYEDGEIEKIKIPVIESIANALNINPMWIIGKSENMYIDEYDIQLSDLEKKLIINFRQADEFDQISVMRTLRLSLDDDTKLLAAHEKENATEEGRLHDLNLIKKYRR